MQVQIQSIHFTAEEKLTQHIQKRVEKLETFYPRIQRIEVFLKLENESSSVRDKVVEMYDERFARMWEFYLISCELMFRTGSQLVFHMQLSRNRDGAPITRDYITDTQRDLEKLEKKLKLEL